MITANEAGSANTFLKPFLLRKKKIIKNKIDGKIRSDRKNPSGTELEIFEIAAIGKMAAISFKNGAGIFLYSQMYESPLHCPLKICWISAA